MVIRAYPLSAVKELLEWHEHNDSGPEVAAEEVSTYLGTYAFLYFSLTQTFRDIQELVLSTGLPDAFDAQSQALATLRRWVSVAESLVTKGEQSEAAGHPVRGLDEFRGYIVEVRSLVDAPLTPESVAELRQVEAEQWAATEGAYERGDTQDAEDIIRGLQAANPHADPPTH